ncbi:sodium-coupled monocarboxylate transporter 1 isoform X3 [Teleopsis dalmanni]|uniref:sodium-coupled monocarboxylate transporter 1 isoform X3 n=1 Tax=Teleopsis dalmanni TaxID=139649 RepID=UPI0018CFB79C|nr:sodium-coupled monocarboxylate transporter 1 isoform X3 [Teleopsis dalmanni]
MSSSTSEIPVNPSWTVASSESSTESTSSSALSSSTVATIVETVKTFVTTSSTTLNAATISTDNIATHSTSMGTESSSSVAAVMEHNTPANKMNVADLSASLQHFGFVDYFVFVLMLLVCAVIGFYFGFVEKKKKKRNMEERRGSEALDYLVGGRKMKVFPVSLSLVASFVSGISLLGTSTEIYVYGTQYAFILITLALSGVISWYVFLPVFCNLQLTSTYEYFELRFSRRIRILGAALFTLKAIIWLPIAVYVPALTFSQVSGIGVHTITPIVIVICTFYTTVGGIKGVVWTDVIQSFVMFGSIIVLMIKGTVDIGGFGEIWKRNMAGGRINSPELTLDPTVRLSVFAVFIGGTFLKIQSTSINQPTVQRFMSLPSLKKVKQTIITFSIGVILLYSCCVYVGLLTFATYHHCDPITTGLAKARDQLVPLLVMHVLGAYPGLPGLFVSGVFSAALSSLSTLLNSLSAVVLEDFVKPNISKPLTERTTAIIMRTVVIVFGLSSIGLVYVVEKLGMMLQLSVSLQSIIYGPMLGIFSVGMLMPWINEKCVLSGSIISVLTMTWICVNAQIANVTGTFRQPKLPVSIESCDYNFNSSRYINSTIAQPIPHDTTFALHHISFLWYCFLGAMLTVIGSNLATLIFGVNKATDMDEKLFAPIALRYFKKTVYKSVNQKDLEMLKK